MLLGLIEAVTEKVFNIPKRNSTDAIVLGNTRAILKPITNVEHLRTFLAWSVL